MSSGASWPPLGHFAWLCLSLDSLVKAEKSDVGMRGIRPKPLPTTGHGPGCAEHSTSQQHR